MTTLGCIVIILLCLGGIYWSSRCKDTDFSHDSADEAVVAAIREEAEARRQAILAKLPTCPKPELN